ncbi:MAG: polyphosphate:AMP phosphotransferase [Rhodocyclaceae bacterium]|jgi:polyphosphate:AMP phosphotransferase|nr:polyphosphate:AMP phosphotransferase [Rhodocyclaceae bacterium]
MFESAELGHRLGKKEFEAALPGLRADLLDAQFELLEQAGFSVLILINGVDGAGKGETVNLLNAWLDPRHIRTHAFDAASDEERERPRLWRFWRALPPRGKVGIFFGNWYNEPIRQRVDKRIKKAALDQRLDEINRFEAMLTREGVLLLKFWFHLSKKDQDRRLKSLAADPATAWRVTERDWHYHQAYDRYRDAAAHALRHTSTAEAPWIVVDGSDEQYRGLLVGRTLLESLQRRLELARKPWQPRRTTALLPAPLDARNLLDALVLRQPMADKDYKRELPRQQGRVALATRHKAFARRSLVIVFEGMDAAGKGGAIRRITEALDARQVRVVPVAAPTEEERAQPYLWRFWRHMPPWGKVVIFDRSWYGRVLVERVEGLCSEADWLRAYAEINDFEDQMVESGAVVVKFWLAVSPEEQLARFQEREAEPHKRFKITPEDWRNRERWPDYRQAVCDMIDRTSTEIAPWTLVEADNKDYARVKILHTLADRLEAALG